MADRVRAFSQTIAREKTAGSLSRDICILIEMLSLLKDLANETSASEKPVQVSATVIQAMQFLNTHYDKQLAIATIAGACGVTSFHLCHSFSSQLGMSVKTYLNQMRISRARMLLRDRGAGVTETAISTGFSSLQYFMRVFRKYTGKSPREWRKSIAVSW